MRIDNDVATLGNYIVTLSTIINEKNNFSLDFLYKLNKIQVFKITENKHFSELELEMIENEIYDISFDDFLILLNTTNSFLNKIKNNEIKNIKHEAITIIEKIFNSIIIDDKYKYPTSKLENIITIKKNIFTEKLDSLVKLELYEEACIIRDKIKNL